METCRSYSISVQCSTKNFGILILKLLYTFEQNKYNIIFGVEKAIHNTYVYQCFTDGCGKNLVILTII